MDMYSLVAAHMRRRTRPAKMDAAAEASYYREHSGLPVSYTDEGDRTPLPAAAWLLALLSRGFRVPGR